MVLSSLALPLLGGALIGLAATLLLVFNGRIAGISGIFGGLFELGRAERLWRAAFVGGLLGGGLLMFLLRPDAFSASPSSSSILILAGLFVGFGTSLGSGCTSGHGVCGISRLSPRSLVATGVFMAVGALAVWLLKTFVA